MTHLVEVVEVSLSNSGWGMDAAKSVVNKMDKIKISKLYESFMVILPQLFCKYLKLLNILIFQSIYTPEKYINDVYC